MGVAACGDDDSGDVVIRRDPNPTTTTSLDREALGLNTEVSCLWRCAFGEDDWARSASGEERAEMESLLDGHTPLGSSHARAEAQRLCVAATSDRTE